MDLINNLGSLRPIDLMGMLNRHDSILFDSSGNFPKSYQSPVSILAVQPSEVIQGNISDPSALERVIAQRKQGGGEMELPRGGLAGWIDYDGSFTFGVYERFLTYNHAQKRWISNLDFLQNQKLQTTAPIVPEITGWSSSMDQQSFQRAVLAAKQYIAAGDIYQVNLAQQFSAPLEHEHDLFSLYQRLRHESPAPMACYGQLAGRELLCSSPETFMRMKGRVVETRPIKGTSPRFIDPEQDRLSAQNLVSSSKENAELVMITDLMRNDLGRVCEYGSVKVDELLSLEKLQHVYHMVSTISGEIRDGLSHLDVLRECLPGGSITGAPKVRAMEVIDELEPVCRGLYTGVVGYLGFNGESQFNIMIRSLVRERGEISYHVGAGIVADSCPEKEYEETLIKARGIRRALTATTSDARRTSF